MSLSRFVILSASIHLILLVGIGHYFTNTPGLEQKDSIKWLIDVNLIMLEENPDDNPAISKRVPTPSPPVIKKGGAANKATEEVKKGEDATPEKETIGPVIAHLQEQTSKKLETMRESFMNRINAQLLLIKTKHFFKTTRTILKGMLEALPSPEELKALEGSKGTIIITYTDEGDFASFTIEAEGEGFRKILEEKVEWSNIPLPKNFLLPYKRLTLNISIENSRIYIVITPN